MALERKMRRLTTVHRFAKAGHYIVSVEGVGADGAKAVGRVAVRVGE